jgi:DNA-binding IclR family transcriptional regulator
MPTTKRVVAVAPPRDGRQRSKTVEKAVHLLMEFALGAPHISVSELARRSSLPPAVVQRIVNSLTAGGILEQESRTRAYMLGLSILELGAVAANHNRLMVAAQPVMQRMNELTSEAVLLTVLDRRTWRGALIHLLDARRPSIVRYRLQQQGYLHASSTRKVLLAHLAPSEIDEVITKVGLPPLTPNTITTRERLLEELEKIRRRGFAISRGEAVTGTTGVPAPIRSEGGTVVASVGVSVPDTRLHEPEMPSLIEIVVRGADEISAALRESPTRPARGGRHG